MKRWTETEISIINDLYASNYPREGRLVYQIWGLHISTADPGSRKGYVFGQLVHPCEGRSIPVDLVGKIMEAAKELPSLRDLQLAKIEHQDWKILFQFTFVPLRGETFCDGAVEALIEILGLFGAKEKLRFLIRQRTKIFRDKKWIEFEEFLAAKHGI